MGLYPWKAVCVTEELLLLGLSMCLAEGLEEPGCHWTW